ncbi:GumC family protein [uncultured Devosia sp.]|uniref:GumC family protein n=1 Tax=uncultured Devosia sp. TaxID=211434 RepID=UPI0035CC7A3F
MDDQEFNLRAALGLLRRQLKLIIITFILVLGVASIALFSVKPAYTATALVLVDPSRKDLLDPEVAAASSTSDSARVESEVEIAKSETILLQVIQDAKLLSDPEFGVKLGLRDQILGLLRIATPQLPTGEDALNSVLDKLRDSVSVQRRGLTYLLAISARADDPESATKIANAMSNAYISAQLNSKIASTLASRDIIQARIADASGAVVASEGAFDTFIADNIQRITEESGRTDIAKIRDDLQAANSNRTRLAQLVETADSSLQQQDFAALSNTLQSDALRRLEAQRQAIAARLAGSATDSPTSIDLRAELAKVQGDITNTAQTELTTLRTQVNSAQSQATDLRTQLRTSVLSSDLPADVLTNIYELQQSSEIARTQYQTLLARMKDLEAQAYLQVADSRIVSPATPPNSPSFPNTRVFLVLAGLVALGLGIGLAFLAENFVGGFTSEEQLRSVLKTNVVASIPAQRPVKKGRGPEPLSSADLVATSPLSVFAEGVRRVRVGVDQALRRNKPPTQSGRIIMVTSAAPNEGKTTTSLALARAYSLSGSSVLLVDCDFRKPSLHRSIGLESSMGLLEYLSGNENVADFETIVNRDPLSSTQVLVGARRSDTATDQLIAGPSFAQLVKSARAAFDIVILDTPPIGPVVDGLYLAQFPDVIVFVTRWASTSQTDARNAVNALDDVKNKNVQILSVLTQQEASKASYRGKYAGYYSEAG